MYFNYGYFTRYNPDLPEDHPLKTLNVMFSQNEDGKDWYELVQTLDDSGTYLVLNEDYSVQIATNEPDRLFPQNQWIVRVKRVDEPETLNGKIVNIKNGKMTAAKIPKVMVVTMAQGKLALLEAGLLEKAEQIIANHPEKALRIWYTDSNEWHRNNQYLKMLATELGLKDKALDALFVAASKK